MLLVVPHKCYEGHCSSQYMLIYESAALTIVAYWVLNGLSPWFASRRGALVYFILALLIHGLWILDHVYGAPLRRGVTWMAGTWMSACLLGVTVGLPLLLAKGTGRLWRKLVSRLRNLQAPVDTGRREFLGNLALPAVAFSIGGGGALGGASNFVVIRLELRIHDWPKALDGFRIGQITDTHVGDFIAPDTVERAVQVLNDEEVHLQVMTGDSRRQSEIPRADV